MGIIRPATPGFLCTLTATILLAVVSFCVPYFKSVYFLEAQISSNGVNGTITFGTLGYCVELSNGTTCSSPSVGYELDINSLVGNELPIEIPTVVVKWITYALVLHIVALALAAGSALFGLLAHIREMSMTCCSTCVSGFAAAVAMLAFIFDLVLFFVAKSRINAVGSASMGNAIWLTLAAWILLFVSGCFYTLGRCCITNRKPRGGDWERQKDTEQGRPDFAEQMRLDAVKAEQDRKALQKQKEVGLSPLPEAQPLTARVEGDQVYFDQPYSDSAGPHSDGGYGGRPTGNGGYVGGGYSPAPAGSRAVDEYYNPSQPAAYPPKPSRQGSSHTTAYAPSSYAPSTYHAASEPQRTMSPPNNQFLSTAPGQYGDPYAPNHTSGGSSYHSAATHQAYPSTYSHYDAYDAQPQQPQPQRQYSDHYGQAGMSSPPMPTNAYPSHTNSYYSAPTAPERNYTLGGDGYGGNSVPPLPEHEQHAYLPYPGETHHSPSPINTSVPLIPDQHTSPGGPRPYRTMSPQQYEESPPGYEQGPLGAASTPAWGGKN